MLLRRVLGCYINDTSSNAGAKRAEAILAKLNGKPSAPSFPSTWPWKPKAGETRR